MMNIAAMFTIDDVSTAAKSSNFNKGLGPDYFDGKMLKLSVELNEKIMTEVTYALITTRILEF
jgi:hypothetical protein